MDYTWIGIKFDNVERASIKLLDEEYIASIAEQDIKKFIFFFANVGEEV